MKLYVVTVGRYNDHHVCGIFESEEKAKLYVELNKNTNCFYQNMRYHCEETLDDRLMDVNDRRKLYSVDVYPDTGKMVVEEDEYYDHLAPILAYAKFHKRQVWDWDKYREVITLTIQILANDEDHALKIAQDKYAEYKAEEAGII